MWNATNETEKNYIRHWDVKNDFAYVLQFFSLISDGLGSVVTYMTAFQLFFFSGSTLWRGSLHFRAYFVPTI